MKRMRWVIGIVVVAAGAHAVPTAAGSSERDVISYLPQRARGPVGQLRDLVAARSRVHASADAIESGSLAEALRGTARLSGRELSGVAFEPADLPGLPPVVAAPVGRLLGAIRASEALLRSTPIDRRLRRVDTGRLARTLATLSPGAPGHERDGQVAERLLRLRERYEHSSYVAAMHRAAITVAAALDRAIPELRGPATSPPTSEHAAGCDVVDQPPVLCVGGEGSNSYEDDYELQIDLGGDDTYANSAGGADLLGGNRLAVSVALDLGGNDIYSASLPTTDGSRAAQGAGFNGGVGVLVDVGGDDTYEVTATGDAPASRSLGDGSLGVGIFADLGGNDSHTLLGDQAGSQTAQGVGVGVIGTGMALDHGSGDDTYLLQAHPPLGATPAPGFPLSLGFGVGAIGTGVFYDDGGTDVMTMDVATAHVDPEDPRPTAPNGAVMSGMGYGALGEALLLSGPGSASRTMRVLNDAPQQIMGLTSPITGEPKVTVNGNRGFGIGLIAGLGAVIDRDDSGEDDDRNILELVSLASDHARADEGCGCPGAMARAVPGEAEVWAMGRAQNAVNAGPAVGLIEDEAGDDLYEVRMTVRAEAVARDDREDPPPQNEPGAEAVAGTADPTGYFALSAQGYGSFAGQGRITDRFGNDTYRISTDVSIVADASATSPRSPVVAAPVVADGILYLAQAVGQGAGLSAGLGSLNDDRGDDTYSIETAVEVRATALPVSTEQSAQATAAAVVGVGTGGQGSAATESHAELVDGGGSDAYTALATYTVSAEPETIAEPGAFTPFFQASVEEGTAILFDLGPGTDSFQVTPPDPACTGTRGGEFWVDCGLGLGIGVNR